MASLIICCLLIISVHTQQSSISFSESINGITMLYNTESVTTTNNEWKVTFTTQQGYDLLLKLNNEWGLDLFNPSNMTITLNGTNYNSLEGDILLVFSVANIQYFGVVIRNEISSQLYKVYPEPFASLPELTNIESTIISPTTPDRWHRITNSTNWYNTIPTYRNTDGLPLEWPIKLNIINDPATNSVRFSQIDFITNDELYSTTYLSSFYPNNGIDIYIMSDGIDESFGIYEVKIEYEIETFPSNEPTLEPTIEPTIEPTLLPSLSPTITTVQPTLLPSLSIFHQTIPKTQSPTISPTKTPTYIPTFAPSTVPTTNMPSKSPTPRPTLYATNLPSAIKTTTTETKNDIMTTNYDITQQIQENIDQNIYVDTSTHSNVMTVTIVTSVLGGIFCIFTILIIFCCIQSQIYEYELRKQYTASNNKGDIEYHVPRGKIGKRLTLPSDTNQIDMVQLKPIDKNYIESTITSTNETCTRSETGTRSETCTRSGSGTETDESKDEEKEGELITADDIISVSVVDVPTSDSEHMSDKSEQKDSDIITGVTTNVSGVNTNLYIQSDNVIIDYNKMSSYLNDDDMSTSSEERILQQNRKKNAQ